MSFYKFLDYSNLRLILFNKPIVFDISNFYNIYFNNSIDNNLI